MKFIPNIAATVILASCLASTPAIAALASADADSSAPATGAAIETSGNSALSAPVSPGDVVTPFLDSLTASVVPPISDSSNLASLTKSVGTMGAYYTNIGTDPSVAPAANIASSTFSSPTAVQGAAVSVPSIAELAVSGAHYVGSGPVVSAAGPVAEVQNSSAGTFLPQNLTPQDIPTPAPPAIFLMGSGLLAMIRRRKSGLTAS